MLCRTEVTSAAAVWVGQRLAAEPHEGTVVHAGADAVYFTSGDDVLAVVSRRATPVPCALVTALVDLDALSAHDRPLRPGDRVTIGRGRVSTPGADVRLARYIDYRMPPFPAEAAQAMRDRLIGAGGRVAGELEDSLLEELTEVPQAALERVLGRGSGLTPYGDDVVCGLLATLLASGDPCAPGLAQRARELAPERTTLLSSTLLKRAAAGDVLPQFARVAAGLIAASPTLGEDIGALRTIGHTSGAGMLLGLHLGLNHITMRSCS